MASMTIEELEARQTEIRSRIGELDVEYRGQAFNDEAKAEWNELNDELDSNEELIGELRARMDRVAGLAGDSDRTERPVPAKRSRVGGSRVPDDLHDLSEYRNRSNSAEDQARLMKEGAQRHLETATFLHERANREDQQENVNKLLEKFGDNPGPGGIAERILVTSSPAYKRAFAKKTMGRELSGEESAALSRAASLTTTAGGFAVPYELDPSIILTSDGRVNPIRQIARIEQTVVNDWKGVSSAGVTASYDGEAVEVSDDTPVLAQPTSSAVGARAFVPFSIEIGQDWAAFGSEMARLFSDSKDELESDKFILGTGTAMPQGLYTGATAIVSSAAASVVAIGDLYRLDEALPPRFRAKASIVANRVYLNKVRAFDTAGGAGLWVQLRDDHPAQLLGLPSYEASKMTSSTAPGATAIVVGDFSHYLIQDRIGMEVELIPHLFATANNLPSGSRGLFAYWRNNGKVLAWQAFRSLKVS
jgi:HK97 family phage major capsid protein